MCDNKEVVKKQIVPDLAIATENRKLQVIINDEKKL